MSKKVKAISFLLLTSAVLTGCAAGAATAGYSIKSQTADSLTVDAEQRIVDRAKREILTEMSTAKSYNNNR